MTSVYRGEGKACGFVLIDTQAALLDEAQQRASGTDDPAETVRVARTKFQPNTLIVVPDNCVNPKQQAALEAKRSQKTGSCSNGWQSRVWLNSAAEPVTVEDLVTDVLTAPDGLQVYLVQSGSHLFRKKTMLKIATSVIPALILSLAAFSAGAAQLPESLMDKDNPGREYWCRGNDINTTVCSLTDVSNDRKFALIQDLPGPACEDLSFGVIDWYLTPDLTFLMTAVTAKGM